MEEAEGAGCEADSPQSEQYIFTCYVEVDVHEILVRVAYILIMVAGNQIFGIRPFNKMLKNNQDGTAICMDYYK